MDKEIHILLVEDENADVELTIRHLRKGGFEPIYTVVDSGDALERALESEGPWDAVLSDFFLPQFRATEALAIVRRHDPDLPFIIVSGSIGEETAVKAMVSGANDYVMKEKLQRLPAALERELKQGESRREKQRIERELAHIVEEIPQIVWTAGPDGVLQFRNRRWNEYVGPMEQMSLAAAWKACVHPEDFPRMDELWQHSVRTGDTFEAEVRLRRHSDGAYRWHLLRATAVRDGGEVITKWFGTSTDMHDHRLALEELERSNADLERFAYVSSHDMKEPLRMVITYSQRLERELAALAPSPKVAEYVGYIVEGGTRMYHQIDALLDYSSVRRARPGDLTSSAGACVAAAQRILAHEITKASAKISHGELPSNLPIAPALLTQLFQNLFSNALKFRTERPPEIRIDAEAQGDSWLFRVADNGIGIRDEYRDRIFEIFQRLHGKTAYPGTGIGLAICKTIVERHRGRIWVESTPGAGSVFLFTLPRRPAA